MSRVCIIGTTTWGLTLGVVLSQKNTEVRVWARTEQEAHDLRRYGASGDRTRLSERLHGRALPANLLITASLRDALKGAQAVILAVPSQTMRLNVAQIKQYLTEEVLLISAAKGLEVETNKRMSEVIADEIPESCRPNICVISGPNLAKEILRGSPAATVVAATNEATARKAQKLLVTPDFCVYTNTDIIGTELGGALKNIIALGAGMVDGLGYGDNTKAALITRGLTEITALGVTLGANPLTFSGLAGLGDLVATCSSRLSRNHFVGEELAKGRSLKDISATMKEVAEGVAATKAARALAQQHGVAMPLTEKIYQVLYEELEPARAAADLIGTEVGHELAGRRWKLFSLLKMVRRRG